MIATGSVRCAALALGRRVWAADGGLNFTQYLNCHMLWTGSASPCAGQGSVVNRKKCCAAGKYLCYVGVEIVLLATPREKEDVEGIDASRMMRIHAPGANRLTVVFQAC